MDNLSKQEQKILADMIRLHREYTIKDIPHNAHGIWLLAGDAARMILRFEYHPFAVTAARDIVNHYIQLYRAA